MVDEITYTQARRRLPESFFGFTSTAELSPIDEIIGQERGVRALRFGLEIEGRGFNIYVSGEPGTGRRTAIVNFLEDIAKTMPVPPDWCYVNNFDDPRHPRALKLPAGKGLELKENMEWFVTEVRDVLTKAFESDEYARRRKETLEKIEDERNEITEKIRRIAQNEGFSLQRSPVGLLVMPVVNGKQISEEEFPRLPPHMRDEITLRRQALQDKLKSALKQFGELEKRAHDLVEELNRGIAASSMEHVFQMMEELYYDVGEVKSFLQEVKKDVLNNVSNILGDDEQEPKEPLLKRYGVNLVVDNSGLEGVPVVMESHPTHRHFFGYMEKEVRFGTLTTDFTLIRGGSAHRANGGFLIIPVEELFADPHVWSSLKRAIRNEMLEIEDIPEPREFLTTKILTPEPIPFDAKVVLIGDPDLHHKLYNGDKDFKELFKVRADFDTSTEWNDENLKKYGGFISSLCEKEDLKHMDPTAVAATIEYSSRLAADQKKLSTRFGEIANLIREASYYASKEGTEYASRRHVNEALEERIYRSNMIQKKLEEMMARGVLLVDTDGMKEGQVNGLSIRSVGNYQFGSPNRVTATIGVGREGIVDIEREAELGGPIHTKGVLILSGYLNGRYAQEKPLSLSARLVFEQSYSGVEGDSASSTELYALLSALSGKPVRQCLAVTGSVNQKGEVQAIGGVNEKVEGFYEVCKAKGLSGEQGVVIPASNLDNLMLKEEVIEAIEEGKFHIYPVKTIDEGIEILTGVKAGKRRPDETYEGGTINYLVNNRLNEMAERIKEFRTEI